MDIISKKERLKQLLMNNEIKFKLASIKCGENKNQDYKFIG